MEKPQWLKEALVAHKPFHNERLRGRNCATLVFRYFHYVKQLFADSDPSRSLRLLPICYEEANILFPYPDRELDGEALGQLEDLLVGFQFKSIFKNAQSPFGQAKLELYRTGKFLTSAHAYFQSCFQGQNICDLAEHAPAPFSSLTLDLFQHISQFSAFNPLLGLSQTSKYFYVFTWTHLIHEISFRARVVDSYIHKPTRWGCEITQAILERPLSLSTLSFRSVHPHQLIERSYASPICQAIRNPLSLTTLDLYDSSIMLKGLRDHVFRFPNLKTLNCKHCHVPSKLDFFPLLTNLTDLRLDTAQSKVESNKIKYYNLTSLVTLTRLRTLHLAPHSLRLYYVGDANIVRGEYSQFSALTALTNLQSLRMLKCRYSGIVKALTLSPFPNLTDLRLQVGRTPYADLNEFLSSKTGLVALRLTEVQKMEVPREMTFCAFQQLTALFDLRIPGLASNLVMESLVNLTRLKVLDISQSPLTDEGLRFLSHLTNLSHLGVVDCERITDEGFICFTGLHKLLTIFTGEGAAPSPAIQHLFPRKIHADFKWAHRIRDK